MHYYDMYSSIITFNFVVNNEQNTIDTLILVCVNTFWWFLKVQIISIVFECNSQTGI